MGKYQGGKKKGNLIYVRCGGAWFEINALIQMEKEAARYGACTV